MFQQVSLSFKIFMSGPSVEGSGDFIPDEGQMELHDVDEEADDHRSEIRYDGKVHDPSPSIASEENGHQPD
jgi:hypothetical protein